MHHKRTENVAHNEQSDRLQCEPVLHTLTQIKSELELKSVMQVGGGGTPQLVFYSLHINKTLDR